ncbi:hypothetical protein [Cytophaga aurantiaca]|uniref:hypothetical protein n=1 Tax=Cytophaga aurantiaca TaxID=29530 RepID=UPI000367E53D|nr:hypothetical protein [Cytophaga aurantiaca]
MKHIQFLTLSLLLFIASINTHADESVIFNFEDVYGHADFCDRIKIIHYDPIFDLLSVQSYSDSLVYTFCIPDLIVQNFANSQNEYLLIRGNWATTDYNRQVFIFGILEGEKWIFNKRQYWNGGCCLIETSNSVADLEHKRTMRGEFLYPKDYFLYKTLSSTWASYGSGDRRSLFDEEAFKPIALRSSGNRYYNDSLQVEKLTFDPEHMLLMIVVSNSSSDKDCAPYMNSLLDAVGLPCKKILENSENYTSRSAEDEYMISYSNSTYKLIIYRYATNRAGEKYCLLELYPKTPTVESSYKTKKYTFGETLLFGLVDGIFDSIFDALVYPH